jgi:hypothetical protein
MSVIEKDVLYPGTVHPPDVDGPVQFTSEDIASGYDESKGISIPFLERRAKEMLAAELQIPFSWAHQPRAVPMKAADLDKLRAEKERLALGHVAGVSMHKDGYLMTDLEVPSDSDRKKLPAVRFVSPLIRWNFKDGDGRQWPGPSIMHVAATSKPVQHHQQPFRLSLLEGDGIRLSLSDYQSVQLAEDAMADEYEETPEVDDEVETETEPETPEPEPEPTDESGNTALVTKLKDVLALLEDHQLVLGDDTKAELEPFLDRLMVALKTKRAQEVDDTDDEETNHDYLDDETEMPTEVPMTPQISMSTDANGNPVKVVKPAKGANGTPAKAPQKVSLSLEIANKATANILKKSRKDLGQEITDCLRTGRMDKPTHDAMQARLKDVKLSLDGDGEIACGDDFLMTLRVHQKLPKGACFPVQLSMDDDDTPQAIDRPSEATATGSISAEDEGKLLEFLYGKAAS